MYYVGYPTFFFNEVKKRIEAKKNAIAEVINDEINEYTNVWHLKFFIKSLFLGVH